jgi:HrpA-like RNA helicase
LTIIGALNEKDQSVDLNFIDSYADTSEINNIGKLMVKFPVAPRYAKMLILSHKVIISNLV